jgi:hypothetical protein
MPMPPIPIVANWILSLGPFAGAASAGKPPAVTAEVRRK